MKLTIAILVALSALASRLSEAILVSTAQRVSGYGYPVEEHKMQTSDGYILTLFRLPYSPKLQNQDDKRKPAMLLFHGVMSSSDAWTLGDPENALGYQAVDAGYDVWLGNARGNVYSRSHVSKNPSETSFWEFSWNEIGEIDLPEMIDFVLQTTGSQSLHYVGHSQGTTTFMVMLSSLPEYNEKIKTSHMLAPVGFMNHAQGPFLEFLAKYRLIENFEFLPIYDSVSSLASTACQEGSIFIPVCYQILFVLGGYDPQNFNHTLTSQIFATHPAGCSTTQFLHYIQEYKSGYFRRYDFGTTRNQMIYNSEYPPEYNLSNVHPSTPLHFYYGDNDYYAAVVDVKRLAARLGDNVVLHRIQIDTWSHLDFIWARQVKEVINDPVIQRANEFEANFK